MVDGTSFGKLIGLTRAEIATKYNIYPSLLDAFEQLGLLKPGNYDNKLVYSPSDEVRLQILIKGRRLGFSLDEIKVILDDPRSKTKMM